MTIPNAHTGAPELDVLDQLSETRRPRFYLQIGVGSGALLERIHAETAIAVDPAFALEANVTQHKREVRLEQTTSGAFFEAQSVESIGGRIDLAVLGGASDFAALVRAFYGVEALCAKRSLIAIEDGLPVATAAEWSDRWKIVPLLAKYRPDLRLVCVDAAPRGLVFVTNLEPRSDTLRRCYDDILDEFHPMPTDRASIEAMYRAHPIVPTADLLKGTDQSLYFRT